MKVVIQVHGPGINVDDTESPRQVAVWYRWPSIPYELRHCHGRTPMLQGVMHKFQVPRVQICSDGLALK